MIYETLPALNESQTVSGIVTTHHTFSNFQVFDTLCEVAVQSMDTMTRLSGKFSFASNCYIGAVMRPGPPGITDISYGDKLFELKWSPPSYPNGFILEYIIFLVNSTTPSRAECYNTCVPSAVEFTAIRVRPETTSYLQVFNVSQNTCFCATVHANNSVGSTPSNASFFWYEYEPSVVTVTTTVTTTVTAMNSMTVPVSTSQPSRSCDDDDDIPIVAIILAVVLVAVMISTIVLGLVFCKMYLLTRESNGNEKPKACS